MREVIAKLGKMITDRADVLLGMEKISESSPEYVGLSCVITDEMAEIALKMGKRKPRTFEEIKKLTGKDEAYLTPRLEKMSEYGMLEYNWENLDGKNPNHEKRWIVPMFVPGCAEFFVMHPTLCDEHPQLADFFEQMARLPLEKVTPMVPPGGAGIGMHVIPVEKAIPAQQQSLDLEHISYWLKKYEGQIGVGICSCRKQQRIRNEGSGDLEGEWCIGVGDMSRYMRETGKGRDITYEEAMDILQKAEDCGYVHQITNIDGSNKIFAICNCAVGVCNALRTSQLFNTPNMSASAYVSSSDGEKCVACGKCVEVCPAGAVKLGQKLITKQGPVQYPRQELPDAVKWGPEKWDKNYRNNVALNCHTTGTAPCKTACPAHIAVQGYIKMAKEGRYLDALKLIKQDNPFPAVCGAICNRRCEDACTRGTIDAPLAIDEIKKFVAYKELEEENRYIPRINPNNRLMKDTKIGIIGSGPAGLSCAYYLAQMGYKPTVFEKEPKIGGMLMNGIPNFRLEKKVVEAEIDVLVKMGVEFKTGVEVGKDVTLDSLRKEGYKGFFVAIGLQDGGKLNVPGDDAEGVISGIDFVKDVNINGNVKLSGKVVVIGGGNIGADIARTAARCGAESVDLYCLESYEEMPMGDEDKELVSGDGITINAGWGQTEVLTKDGKCTGVKFRKCVSVKNAEGRFDPQFDDNVVAQADCDTLIYCIGQKAAWGQLLDGSKVVLSGRKLAEADPITLQTAEPDVFVGGDAYTGQKFAIDAIAAGREGAESLHRFVNVGQSLTIHRNLRQFYELDKKNILLEAESFDKPKRQVPGIDESKKKSFSDERCTFTEEQVQAEASRCLSCGRSIVDPNRCIGCGLCTTRCEFDAIHLDRVRPEASNMYTAEDKFKAILPYEAKRVIKILKNKNK